MRRCAVVNWVPDLERFFKRGEIVIFDTLNEAIEQVTYFHDHPHEAQSVAQRGYEAVKEHTWDKRIETILEAI